MATNSNSLHYKKHRIRMRRSGLQFLLCHKPGIWHRLIPVLSWAISSLEAFKELEYTSKAPPSQCISNSIKDSILLVKIFHSPSLKQTSYICSSKHLFILFFFLFQNEYLVLLPILMSHPLRFMSHLKLSDWYPSHNVI